MKTLMKLSCVAAVALALTSFGAPQAQAGGWAVAGGVVGGLAVGTAIGATVATAATPVYYTAPGPGYAAPSYYAPPVVAVAPAYYCGPRVVCVAPYAYCHPFVRAGFGWGPRYYHGGHYYHR
ncbi:MAG TPA: hypothetical protein VK731_09425 [Candidatus Cybelea sp.]|nr:hypothetical protein [Candidatus Cybelea sp.]